ncbi:MAG TPA: cell division protein FtsK [Methyloprofundus sp.]|nr:cell division protein FtsK [Methyloprofundus sp.]HIL79561.1 cell division protein FtsK [Methylococcales bacterium]
MELASADADAEVLPINENTLQTTGGLESAFNEFETELKSFFPDQEGSSTVTSDQFSHMQNSEGEELYTKQNLNLTQTPDSIQQDSDFLMQEEGTLVNSLDHEQTLDEAFNDIGQDPGVQLPADELTTKTAKPYTLANDDDFINRALQAAENEALYALDNKQTNDQLGVEERSQKLGESGLEAVGLAKQPDFMIQALQAAKEKQDAENQSNKQQGAEESSGSQQSLFNQAEKTAANIISSFSQRFSKSLGMQLKPAFQLPSITLLQQHQQSVHAYTEEELDTMSRSVERVLNDYKVSAEVVGAYPGPIITRFELSLAPGIKVSRVNGLAKDLARAMLVTSVRVVEIIEGTPYIGLEIPNQERELVSFREIIASAQFQQEKSPITLALGKDVSGQTVVADLGKMPHLLVAGTTGSGKSVAINTMILSMLYKATPDQVRMIMVDPKMLELSIYEGIPHLLTPVVTDMKEAQNALRWAVAEMERRYKLMSKVSVRNLAGFNQKIKDAEARGETIRDPLFQLTEPLAEGESFPVLTTLPSIVIVIDELADMMMVVGKKVEELIARLAQKARAAGIHLILATQRPSVDVLTGLIKANVPTRISFQVSSRIDSRTILDQGGAEALLGNGDMLFLPSGTSVPTRSHGAFVDDHEVHAVVDYLKTQGSVRYVNEIIQEAPAENAATIENAQDAVDELYDDAVSFVMETGRASISSVQRRFKVGYNRAARMIDQMEEENIVSEPEGNGSRRVLGRE